MQVQSDVVPEPGTLLLLAIGITGVASLLGGIAVDGTYVYWANEGTNSIGRATLDGTGANQSFITGANGPAGVAVDGTSIYWANGTGGPPVPEPATSLLVLIGVLGLAVAHGKAGVSA